MLPCSISPQPLTFLHTLYEASKPANTHTHTARKVRVKYESSRSIHEYIEAKQDHSSYIYSERYSRSKAQVKEEKSRSKARVKQWLQVLVEQPL